VSNVHLAECLVNTKRTPDNGAVPFQYEYPRPALTVDCVVFGYDGRSLRVLLIERAAEPFRGRWALPGGFVNMDETIDAAALRELEEETGLVRLYLEQLYTFGDLGRDPRERVVSVAYFALVKPADHVVRAASDAKRAEWFPVDDLPALAFDHPHIVETALERLRAKIRYRPVGFELLPRKFTLTELQRLYEAVLGRELDKRNFRKRILSMDLLEELDELEQGVARRAARLYRFDEKKYRKLAKDGFEFSL
jgi:ADP-ribose pyrophosphatase YjhB (NUDIX family)